MPVHPASTMKVTTLRGQTPTYVDFHALTVNMSFCSFGEFTLEAILIWQDTGTKANHLQRKSIVIKSMQKEKAIEGCAANELQRIGLSAISRQLSARCWGSFSA